MSIPQIQGIKDWISPIAVIVGVVATFVITRENTERNTKDIDTMKLQVQALTIRVALIEQQQHWTFDKAIKIDN